MAVIIANYVFVGLVEYLMHFGTESVIRVERGDVTYLTTSL